MKYLSLFLAVIVFSGAAAAGGQKNSASQRPTLGKEPEQQAPPTLGQGPSLGGPLTATIMDARRLRTVRKVYVGMMDNSLNLRLIEDFAKRGPFRVVDNRSAADAILRGSCFDSPHLKEVHSEVFLTGQDGKAIWQDIIHQPYRPPPLKQAVTETANLIVTHLRESIEVAERK